MFDHSFTPVNLAIGQSAPSFTKQSSPFVGTWNYASESQKACKQSDFDARENDGLIRVNSTDVDYWESNCKIKKQKTLAETTAEMLLACSGEGMSWQVREVWHTQKVGSQKTLTIIQTHRGAEVEDGGKKIGNRDPFKPTVQIYISCN